MPHPVTELKVQTVTKPAGAGPHEVRADTCVMGAGIAGMSAAIESARLGRKVVLVDGLPALGGQMVNSLIGLFAGVFGNAPEYEQLTHGIFDDIFRDLGEAGSLYFDRRQTMTVHYDEVALGRWLENTVRELGVKVVLGAVIQGVHVEDGRVRSVSLASRYGDVTVSASGFVDATGDAALSWEAGQPCRVPEREIYGSQQVVVENVDEAHEPERGELSEHLAAKADEYGLTRREGLAFFFPGRGTAVLNMTHIEAPLDPVGASEAGLHGKAQADQVMALLREEFPKAFGEARIRAYGFPGRRQTRWIEGLHHLTVDEVRAGTRFADAVARTAWPIELHDTPEGFTWETFDADHVHYVPLRSMTPAGIHNLLAAGRCIDADPAALSSVRVMGPCAAMGAGAAHALDLAAGASVHGLDPGLLGERLRANLD